MSIDSDIGEGIFLFPNVVFSLNSSCVQINPGIGLYSKYSEKSGVPRTKGKDGMASSHPIKVKD